ncbi:MAG TPA: SpoIIE family protein phosphatase [Vicinamibacteria bacterium]|nr:SpoIIE family protein phosphatase [Vicinamibacteria bacterium]
MSHRFASVTTRLIAWTLLACGTVYATTIAVSNALARRLALTAAERAADARAEAAARRVESVLASIEDRARLAAALAAAARPEGRDDALRRALSPGRELSGVTFSFEPAANEAPAGEAAWSEPQQSGSGAWQVTYAPVAVDGDRPGVVAARVSLEWLDGIAASLADGRGFAVILSRAGRLLAFPHREAAGASRPLLEELPAEPRAQLEPVVGRMLAGERGFVPVEVQGERHRLTYRPLGRAGWSLALLSPEQELLADVRLLRLVQAALAATGLALLAAVTVLVSRRITRPVKALASSAEQMATGDLELELPTLDSPDEIGGLARAFRHMRDSLKAHIQDLRNTTAAKERLESELRIARRIQADMLPQPLAGGPGEGYELAATLVPARAVGGDLFDHFRAGASLHFLVGDVSGKGVGAALFMARAKTLFETVAAHTSDPAAVLAELNRRLSAENDAGMYVTAVLGNLDLTSGELTFALAGHEAPVRLSGGSVPEPVRAEGGPVVGLLDAAAFPLNRLRLAAGEAIVLYTDGVPDARNPADELFEAPRLISALGPVAAEPAGRVTEGLLAAVRAFAGGAPQADDITILTLRYLGDRPR